MGEGPRPICCWASPSLGVLRPVKASTGMCISITSPERSGSTCFERFNQVARSILMLHEAIKRLDASVLNSVELIAKPKCHFNARFGRGVLGVLTHFEVLNYALAGLFLMKAQHLARSRMRSNVSCTINFVSCIAQDRRPPGESAARQNLPAGFLWRRFSHSRRSTVTGGAGLVSSPISFPVTT